MLDPTNPEYYEAIKLVLIASDTEYKLWPQAEVEQVRRTFMARRGQVLTLEDAAQQFDVEKLNEVLQRMVSEQHDSIQFSNALQSVGSPCHACGSTEQLNTYDFGLAKIIKQENMNATMLSDSKNIIGIASNEGSAPSDADYITSINKSLSDKWRSKVTYLYQNNQNSTADGLNAAFNDGSYWLTYIGHGSGYAWPSMYDNYSTEDISAINNSELTKPVIIDVACQNGRLLADHLGSQFMNSTTKKANNGAAAYFGGSVNISWHPPALMARGIAFEHMNNNYSYLGEALFAGQLYLSKNWANAEDVIDNVEWYHLQGDPSFSIKY